MATHPATLYTELYAAAKMVTNAREALANACDRFRECQVAFETELHQSDVFQQYHALATGPGAENDYVRGLLAEIDHAAGICGEFPNRSVAAIQSHDPLPEPEAESQSESQPPATPPHPVPESAMQLSPFNARVSRLGTLAMFAGMEGSQPAIGATPVGQMLNRLEPTIAEVPHAPEKDLDDTIIPGTPIDDADDDLLNMGMTVDEASGPIPSTPVSFNDEPNEAPFIVIPVGPVPSTPTRHVDVTFLDESDEEDEEEAEEVPLGDSIAASENEPAVLLGCHDYLGVLHANGKLFLKEVSTLTPAERASNKELEVVVAGRVCVPHADEYTWHVSATNVIGHDEATGCVQVSTVKCTQKGGTFPPGQIVKTGPLFTDAGNLVFGIDVPADARHLIASLDTSIETPEDALVAGHLAAAFVKREIMKHSVLEMVDKRPRRAWVSAENLQHVAEACKRERDSAESERMVMGFVQADKKGGNTAWMLLQTPTANDYFSVGRSMIKTAPYIVVEVGSDLYLSLEHACAIGSRHDGAWCLFDALKNGLYVARCTNGTVAAMYVPIRGHAIHEPKDKKKPTTSVAPVRRARDDEDADADADGGNDRKMAKRARTGK